LHETARRAVLTDECRVLDRTCKLGQHRAYGEIAGLPLDRAGRLFLGDEDLVDLLAGTDTRDDSLDGPVTDQLRREVRHPGAPAAGDVRLPGRRRADRGVDRVDGVVTRQQEARSVVRVERAGAAGSD